jgi:D-alanine-D-alanine ligase
VKTEELKTKRVGVLMGGISAEREVSLETGHGVLEALAGLGYRVAGVDWGAGDNPADLLEDAAVDVVWNALHGTYGEDGAVQGLLQCLGLPYTGSGILASALAMDKLASKRVFESNGLATPVWRVLDPGVDVSEQLAELDVPLVVKPAREGSSVGVSIVRDREAVPAAVEQAHRHRGPVLVETYVPGTELHVGLLDEEVLGTIEVRPAADFYDYDAKYRRDDTGYVIPPSIDDRAVAAAEHLALEAYRAVGCTGHARVDLRVNARLEPFLLEVNTLPGMTSHSLLPKIAAYRGMSYSELCERILLGAHLD